MVFYIQACSEMMQQIGASKSDYFSFPSDDDGFREVNYS
jgi:hypothetical protein